MENENRNAIQPEETEIDLAQLFRAIIHRWYLLLIFAIIGGGIAFGISRFMITPMYNSTARMLVLTKETTLTSLADLQIGSQLTGDYTQLIKAPDVLSETIEDVGLDMSYKALAKRISINNPSSTRILELTVTDPDPEKAAEIVNTLAANASRFISDVMEVSPPKIFSAGEVPTEKASPSNTRNAAIGVILGILLAIIIIAIRDMMDDTIRTEEDVEKYLGLTVLASIPDRGQIKDDAGYYGYGEQEA